MINTAEFGPHHVDLHVGALIRAKRKAVGMSQEELAGALGISFQQIQKYEKGSNRVSSSKLYEIAQKLNTPLVTFFEGLEQPTEDGSTPHASMVDFLNSRGSQDLLAAFKSMRPELRRRLVALAQAMSETYDEIH